MIKYLAKIFKAFPEEIRAAAATPAANHLFEVRDENKQKLLPEEQARAFHHSVAQLLFLCGRARPHQRSSYVRKDAHTNMSVDVRMALLNARANVH